MEKTISNTTTIEQNLHNYLLVSKCIRIQDVTIMTMMVMMIVMVVLVMVTMIMMQILIFVITAGVPRTTGIARQYRPPRS